MSRRWLAKTTADGDQPPAPLSESRLSRFASVADRVAVVDTETTGLYSSDRVLEIAVVTLDLEGRVIDEWDTLIDPQRDVGPTWIHGVTASMLTNAPTFDEIAGELAARLHGAILSAHNLAFDTRMLRHEFQRHEVEIAFGQGLDTLALTRCRLGVACEENGIVLAGAHEALTDARATAELLLRIEAGFETAQPAAVTSTVAASTKSAQHRRDTTAHAAIAAPSYLAELASRLNHKADNAEVACYLDLLDRAMADLHLDEDERHALAGLAHEIGLDDAGIRQAHNLWMRSLIDGAAEDGIVDRDEYDQLLRAAHVLDIDPASVENRTLRERTTTVEVELQPGLSVCFTGAAVDASGHEIPRDLLEEHARSLGLAVEDRFTKSRCDLLIAADASTTSTKADKARRWGIPIVTASEVLAAVPGSAIPAFTVPVGGATAHTCRQCGRAFTTQTPRAPKVPRCSSCGPATTTKTRTTRKPGESEGPLGGRRLWCSPNCGHEVRQLIAGAGGTAGKSLSKTVYAVVVATGDEHVPQVLRAQSLNLVVVSEQQALTEISDQLARHSPEHGQSDAEHQPATEGAEPTKDREAAPPGPPPNWYPDPLSTATWRWWDGNSWTNHTA